MYCRSRGVQLFVAILALGLMLSSGAGATITDCPGPVGFKVYLDKPSIAGNQVPDIEFLFNELYFLFDERKEREWVEWLPSGDAGSITFVQCKQRQPSIDGSDFDSPLVDLLYNEDVLVELVASLHASGNSAGVAHLSFVVVPVRQLHFEKSNGPDGLFRTRLTTSGAQADFVELFKRVRRIDHYVAAGLGVKAARQGDYEVAQGGLCRSLATLGNDASRALIDLLSVLAVQNLVSAQADNRYKGPLLLLDSTQPCPKGLP